LKGRIIHDRSDPSIYRDFGGVNRTAFDFSIGLGYKTMFLDPGAHYGI